MTAKIKILSEQTINQIAAGEVIENPASVVKELIENSLDAKSKKIVIEVVAGGFGLIRISDDGSGMSQDDAILSLERHATSKIRKVEDLFAISSMGFRGEALASIAAISKFTMITAVEGDRPGVKVVCEGGRFQSTQVCPRQRGTTIEVRSLFYTTPARKKFQKSPPQSFAQINKIINMIALSRPDVEFIFLSQDKPFLHVESAKIEERIEGVLGKEMKNSVIPISYEESWIKIEGVIGLPSAHRSNRLGQYLFINERPIYSKEVSYAVSNGYGTMLTIGRYPIFVLYITLAGHLLDINVHPQKREVRFHEEDLIKQAIAKAVRLSLQRPVRATYNLEKKVEEKSFSVEEMLFSKEKSQSVEELKSYDTSQVLFSPKQQEDLLFFEEKIAPKVEDLQFVGMYKQCVIIDSAFAENIFNPPYIQKPYEGLFIIDLQSVSSRIYFEHVRKHLATTYQGMTMQTLLFPVKLNFSTEEAFLIQEHLDVISSLGMDIRVFGEHTFIIDSCLCFLDEEKLKSLIEGVLEDLRTKTFSLEQRKERAAIRACKIISSKKIFYDLSAAKILLTQLLKTEHPYFCPLGKKIIGYLDQQNYERLFCKEN